MRLKIDPRVFDLFPGFSIVLAAATDIDNQPNPDASSYLDAAWDRAHSLRDTYPNAQSHPYVKRGERPSARSGYRHASSRAPSKPCYGAPSRAATHR